MIVLILPLLIFQSLMLRMVNCEIKYRQTETISENNYDRLASNVTIEETKSLLNETNGASNSLTTPEELNSSILKHV